jgi:hypothetical protein
MFDMEEFIIAVFCCVDDLLKEITHNQPIRSKGFRPALADSEVLTMEIVAEYQGIDTEQAMWKYFRGHWLMLFPRLSSQSAFVRQAANLWQYKQLLQQRLSRRLQAFAAPVHLVDGIPIPLCCFSRAPRCWSFQGVAEYGYCTAKKQTYYCGRHHRDRQLHLPRRVDREGVITLISDKDIVTLATI